MDLGLRDTVCLVTGSTGGIGLETARLLAAEGATRRHDGRPRGAGVGEALHVAPTSRGPASRSASCARRASGSAASTCSSTTSALADPARFEEVTDESGTSSWQLNVMSYVRAIRAVLPGMRERGAGVIVNVSSTAGKRPSTSMPDYSVTKAAVLSLSRLVADVYAKDGIRCNAVTPGPTATQAWLGEGGPRRPAGGASGKPRRGARRRSAAGGRSAGSPSRRRSPP